MNVQTYLMGKNYKLMCLIFDPYRSSSLPKLSCDSRNKGCNVSYYHVNDTTNIEKLSLKEFLSNEKTKRELTTYLPTKFISHLLLTNVMLLKIIN